jgi:hypothetical protein
MESLGNSIARGRVRLLSASAHYMDRQSAARLPLPPPTSDLPEHTASRLASIASARIAVAIPRLDPEIEAARDEFLATVGRQLQSWLDFFAGENRLDADEAEITARRHSPDDLRRPLERFSIGLQEGNFARLDSWAIEPRATILTELQSMRRLEALTAELNRWLAQIPGSAAIVRRAIPVLSE